MKNKFNFLEFFQSLKSTLLVTILLFTCVSMWGAKITSISDIVSGGSYYIGATVSETDYYFIESADHGASTGTGKAGSSVTDKANADVVTFTAVTGGWTIQFSSGYYLSLASSKANGKVDVVENAAVWTITEVSSLLNLKINSYELMKNSSTSLNFGSYGGGQKNVWLEAATTKLATPQNLSTNTTKNSAALSWGEVTNAGSYKVNYKVNGAADWIAVSPNPTTNSANLSGLSSNTTYAWQVIAVPSNTTLYAESDAANSDFTTKAITYTDYITECGTDPFISVSPTTIEGLGYVYGSAASESTVKTFTVTGNYLNSNVTITAPTGFEVKTSTGNFTDEIVLTPEGVTLSSTISVRLISGQGVKDGGYSGDVTISSDDITESKTVALSATVTPAQLATPVVTATPAVHQITLSWAAIENADSYQLVWNGGDPETINSTSVVKDNLTGGTEYSYSVVAVGSGNYSSSAAAEGKATADKATYAVTWYVNGSVLSTENVEEGATATTPANPSAPAACSEKVFTGWTATENYSSETTAPEYVSTPVTVTDHALNLYAVFADQGGEPEYYVKGSASDLTAGQVVVIHDYTQNVVLTTEGYSSEKIPCVSVTPSNNKIPVASITDKMKWMVGVVSGKYTFSQGSNYLMAADWYLKFGTTNITQWTLISMSNGYRFSQSDESDYPYINNDKSLKDITSYENSAAILNVFIPLASYSNYTTTCAKIDPELTGTAKTVAIDVLFDVSTMFTSKSDGTITYSVTSEPESAVYELDGKDFLAETAGAYTITASQEATDKYLADEATAILTVSAKEAATLTLSAIGNEYDFEDDDLYVTKEITLPDDVEYKAANKTFVGWSSETIPDEGAEPTTNYYAKGSKYTIAKAEDKLYAVYATETEGAITWSVATTMTGMQAGDILAFACINDNNSVANGNKPDEKNFLDSVNITVANDIVTAGAEKIVPITLGGDAENGWNMNVKNLGYIYRSAKNEMGFKDTPTAFQSISIDGTSKEATVKVSGDSIVMYNSGSPRFSIYKSGQTAIKLLKAAQGASTFSKYTTSGTLHVDAPTFDDDTKPGTYTDAEHLVMINVPENTEVRYTINGGDPTTSSTLYDENDGITLNATATIRAKAFIGDNASALLEGTFTIHNYNSIDALLTNALNADATLNVTDAYIHKVYAVGPNKQVFIQEASGKGIILATSAELPEGIVAGNKLTASITGYCKINNGRPQLGTFTLADGYTYSAGTRPEPTVLTAVDETTVGANLLKLVKVENIYTIEEGAGNLITMNANALGTGTAYTVYDIWNNVNVILPVQTDACNVIGLFNFDGTTYSVMPLQTSDFAVVDPQDATLPTVNPEGGATSATAVAVATGEGITITPADGFSTAYKLGEGAKTDINKATVVNINETTSLTVYASRPYFNDAEKVYYYIADPSLIKYTITLPSGLDIANGKILSDVSTAAAGATVTLTPEPKEHYTLKTLTVSYENEGPQTCELTGPTAEGKYTFEMPAFNVVVSASWQKDPTYEIDYQTGGKQTTGGSKPTEGNKYEGDSVTLATNTWTTNNFIFKQWRVVYVVDQDTTDVTIQNNKFAMPAHDVKIIAQWTPTYTVTYDKGSATSATGSVTEDPQIEGAVIAVKANGFSAPGYTFTGWKANTTGDQIYQAGDEYTMTAAAVTFTAQWEGAEYTKDGQWELVTSNDQLEAGRYYVIACNGQGKTLTATIAGSTNKYLSGVATTFTDESTGDKAIIKKSDLGTGTVIFQLGGETDAWTLKDMATEKYYHTGSNNNPVWLDNARTWETISYNKMQAWENTSYYGTDTTLQYNTSGGFRPYTSSQKAVQLYRFYRQAFKVTYDANGGTGAPAATKADPTTQIATLSSTVPTKTGNTFTGWTTAQGGTGTKYQAGAQFGPMTKNETLYAQWELKTYNVAIASVEHAAVFAKQKFTSDENKFGEGESKDIQYGKTVTLSYNSVEENYVFKSWSVTKATDQSVTVTVTDNEFVVPDYAVTISAEFEKSSEAQFTLTYDANGGEGTMEGNPFTKIYNTYITVSDNKNGEEDIFTKDLCTFTGWNTEADGTGTSYAAGAHFYIKSDVTLYAQWKGTGATYYLDKTAENNIRVSVGAAPQWSTATCVNTYNGDIDQTTAGNSITITLKGYAGMVVKNISANVKANASGNGTLDITSGGKSVYSTTYPALGVDNKSQYQSRSFNEYGFYPFLVNNNEDIVIVVASTNKSAYIQNITLEFGAGYSRTFTSHNVSTVCVPYAVKPEDRFGAAFYEIAYKTKAEDDESTKIYFDEVSPEEDLVAGKPYVIIPEKETMVLVYSGEAAESPVVGEKGLTGTFDGIAKAATNDLNGNYIFNSNKYWLCGGNCWLDANRAYINKDAINAYLTPVSPAPGRRRIVMGANGTEEVTTPTTPTDVVNVNENANVNAIQKLIIDNQLIIIRGGKMYNAAGALVK